MIGGLGPDEVHLGDGDDIFQDDIQTDAAGTDTVFGGAGNDTYVGGGGSDIFDGGAGDDIIHAGTGSETFVFASGEGSDLVTGFDVEADVLDLSGVATISDFTDLNGLHMSQHGDDVRIRDGHGLTITLQDIDLGDLGADNFLF